MLDRLTDDEPQSAVESREERVLSSERLQQSVVRDLAWLLNTENLANCHDLGNCELARSSVINFGLPSLSGRTASGIDVDQLKKDLRRAICDFEPRLVEQTIQISAELSSNQMSANTLRFMIEAVMWAQPLPIHLYLQTEVDLDTGHFEVSSVTS